MIPNGWQIVELGELVTFQRGHDLPKEVMQSGIYPVAGSNGIIGYHNKWTAKGPSITIGRSGNIGNAFYYKTDFWAHNTSLYIKEFKGCHPHFIYYLLKTMDFSGHNSGSAVPTLNRNYIHPIKVLVPLDIREQIHIATILSSLDDKIELNLQMNKTLEAIAQTIFREWFVDFRFPGFDGELIDGLPKGWRKIRLCEIVSIEKGLSYKGSGLAENKGIPMINLGSFDHYYGFKKEGLKFYTGEYKERNLVSPGDVVIANTDITQGRTLIGSPAVVPIIKGHKRLLFTHHVYAIRNKSQLSNNYLFYVLAQPSFRARVSGFSTGTTVLAISRDTVMDYEIVLPEYRVVDLFDNLTASIHSKVRANEFESETLTQLRDLLLPKLMTGKIRVPQIN